MVKYKSTLDVVVEALGNKKEKSILIGLCKTINKQNNKQNMFLKKQHSHVAIFFSTSIEGRTTRAREGISPRT